MSTTIAISPETRDQLKEFGDKGETYDDIVTRLLRNAKDRQIHDLLMDTSNCLTIDQARGRLKR